MRPAGPRNSPPALQLVASSALAAPQRRFQTLFDEAFLGPLNLAHTDMQNLGDVFAACAPIIPWAFIAIEQDQGVDDLLRLMRAFPRYRFEFLPLFSSNVTLSVSRACPPITITTR